MARSRRMVMAMAALLAVGAGAVAFVAIAPADPAVELVFRVSVWDDVANDWELRWVGTPFGPILSGPEISPEDTAEPFVGFARRFRVEWEATSANGAIAGYRHRASQDPISGFLPADVGGLPQYDQTTSFVFDNSVPVDEITPGACASGWPDCPEDLRFASGVHVLRVQAIDETGATNDALAGELLFNVNYPPVTELNGDLGYPAYWDGGSWVSVAEGDTVPDRAYLLIQMAGLDRLDANVAELPVGLPCCDVPLDPFFPEVRFQARVAQLVGLENGGPRQVQYSGLFSEPDVADTIGIEVGPFATTLALRTVDEHDRRDPEPVEFSFVGGFAPRMIDVQPADGSRMLARLPGQPPWPQNEVGYEFSALVTRYWDPVTFSFEEEDGPGRLLIQGQYLRHALRFEGAADPREPQGSVRAFSYSMFNASDPHNLRPDGPADSPDLSFFATAPVDNVWDFGAESDRPEVFVPSLLWVNPALFDQAAVPSPLASMGTAIARQLGEWTLRVRGRTTAAGDTYSLYRNVRPDDNFVLFDVDVERLGRVTEVAEHQFTLELGLDPTLTGSVTEVWPPAGFDLLEPGLASAASVDFDEVLLSFDESIDAAGASQVDNFRVYVTAMPSDRPQILLAELVGFSQVRLQLDGPLRGERAYTVAYRNIADIYGNRAPDWVLADLQTTVDVPDVARAAGGPVLRGNRPNPFNPRTTIDYELPRAGEVRLELLDVAGRRVRVLVEEWKAAGVHEAIWDGADRDGRAVASGVYLAKLSGLGGSDSKRLVLVR